MPLKTIGRPADAEGLEFFLDPSLVLYLPLWKRDGSSIISEDAYGHLCMVTGALWGLDGRTFAGGDDLININSALTPLAATTAGTWSIWANMADVTPAIATRLISFGDTNATELIWFAVSTAGLLTAQCFKAGVGQWRIDTNASPLADNVWFYATLVQNGTSPVLYINGTIPAQTFITSTDKTVWFSVCTGLDNGRIGCASYNNNGNIEWFTGTVGAVRLCSRGETTSEILQSYNATKWRRG